MDPHEIRILLIGRPASELDRAAALAAQAGAEVVVAHDETTAMATMRRAHVALVMIDVALDVAGFIAQLRAERFAVPVLACGVDAPAALAVAAIRAGADDYVPLPPELAMIAAALAAAAERPGSTIIGQDAALRRAVDFAGSIAAARMPVLLTGPVGAGKALLARTIHAQSGRQGPMLTVECAGVPADVLESDLFGHQAGAFPEAVADRCGKLDEARGGTLFLRDIDWLPAALQARLAMALASVPSTRLIASTTADLAARVRDGRFRADLAARLDAARIALPPLTERLPDIPLLAHHFAARVAATEGLPMRPLTDDALSLLAGHGWPGNVGELENVVRRAAVLARDERIGALDLVLSDGSRLSPATDPSDGIDPLVGRTVEEVERALILKTLERCRGNCTSASNILGISVRTMRNKLKIFIEAGISVPAA